MQLKILDNKLIKYSESFTYKWKNVNLTKSYNGIGNQLVIILYTVGKFWEGLTV